MSRRLYPHLVFPVGLKTELNSVVIDVILNRLRVCDLTNKSIKKLTMGKNYWFEFDLW